MKCTYTFDVIQVRVKYVHAVGITNNSLYKYGICSHCPILPQSFRLLL